jgi:hypothetical protein
MFYALLAPATFKAISELLLGILVATAKTAIHARRAAPSANVTKGANMKMLATIPPNILLPPYSFKNLLPILHLSL